MKALNKRDQRILLITMIANKKIIGRYAPEDCKHQKDNKDFYDDQAVVYREVKKKE